jgi:aryl-alcohol dehydrogenase-like predicted oxidoreductase
VGKAVHPITAVQAEYSLWSRDPEAENLPTFGDASELLAAAVLSL